jgi:CRISPR-associated protein Cas2
MTVVVTRDVVARFRGVLSSCMLEIAPGVYTAPRMTRGVRERVWQVLTGWFFELGGGSIVMTWREAESPGGQAVLTLGIAAKELVVHDGVHMVRSEWSEDAEPAGDTTNPPRAPQPATTPPPA